MYDNPMPETTLSPQLGTMNLATGKGQEDHVIINSLIKLWILKLTVVLVFRLFFIFVRHTEGGKMEEREFNFFFITDCSRILDT